MNSTPAASSTDSLIIDPGELGLAGGALGAADGGDAHHGGIGELLGAPNGWAGGRTASVSPYVNSPNINLHHQTWRPARPRRLVGRRRNAAASRVQKSFGLSTASCMRKPTGKGWPVQAHGDSDST